MRIITNSIKSNPFRKTAIQTADKILENRRPFKSENFTTSDYKYLQERIATQALKFIQQDEKIPLVLIGFSMKSPSPAKTLSQFADRAEYEALNHLNNFTESISDVYDVGAKFKIYTDGRIFTDSIVGASDERVTKYIQGLRNFLTKLKSKKLDIIAPEDFYKTTGENARKMLFSDFPVKREEILSLLEKDIFLKEYKTFMRDFYAKDIRAQNPGLSIRQSRNSGEKVALSVICAAESLGRYVNSIFGDRMIRLSVHAKPVHDIQNKVGIYLNALKENCPMPWHGAALKIPQPDGSEKFIYEKKSILENLGCKLIPDIDGKGEYFELPLNIKYNPRLSFRENLHLIKEG